ncbi:glycerol-3-phosphate ABC transporter substrate-binding protein [Pseudomonas fluorescens]|mgnify:FL=1|jgi:transmembrane sensor|uniref:FecR domain-containing protein n=1 Tax=Pseudomonas fluorescens TaxID=294 RepID=A0A1B3CXL1_PSEFL|nr:MULTISPECIES: FecR domain-containing protein [Pseudomonas]AOE69801.1 glycerol-3-phosphate ABC transporter substrate-binding protein [Pseudomonas fluorescens]AOE75629.1 glycerol-3-phosphate ABC transporter substrate-binding protein [Pseudomonas fluorescens]MDR6577255.1 transmembrane sensor [Pseudomonas extremaustralis]QOU04139.1 FecR domain-containing protein [Pseudomonas fluorescens]WEX14820.1 FecR domain-containing protein [Pseudomonas sp. G11]
MDPNNLRPHELADEVLQDPAMDQALDWLIALQCPRAGQQAEFEAWLARDPAHVHAFGKAQAAWGGAPVHSAAVALAAPRKPSAWRRLQPHWKPLATAAVLLLGLFSFSNLPVRLQADHLTVVGERQRLQLDDGSKVLLNTNSAFSSRIEDHQRIARLYQGEAFFEVVPSRGLPLEIDAGPVRASVRDTAFAVRYLNGEAQVQVQRGDVDLSTTFDDARVRLSAGESIRIGPKGFGPPAKLDANKDLAWVQGRLIFENCPMSEVLAELRRYYPGWIVNTNDKLASIAVTGNYRLDQPLDVVRSLAHITSAKLSEYPALVILN